MKGLCRAQEAHLVIPGLLEWGWLAAAVGLPLLVNPWGALPFELPKALLLQGLALCMALIATILTLEGCLDWHLKGLRVVLGSVLALGLVLGAATIFSRNPRTSLWGSYIRQQGLLTNLSYLVLFTIVACQLRTERQAARLTRVLVWSSAPIVV